MLNVFMPAAPNPTSGFLLLVPESEVIPLSMTVEQAIKLVVSGGIVTPPGRPEDQRRIRAARAAAPEKRDRP